MSNTCCFKVQPISQYTGVNAAIKRPKEITFFSYDDKHKVYHDDRSLRYYYTPRLGTDLSKGFESFQQLDDTVDDHLNSLLKSIIDLERHTGSICQPNFITWRGMLTKIMVAPYDHFNEFEMNATFFQGTIFIEENHDHKLKSRMLQYGQTSRAGTYSQDLMSYWGYKFEAVSLIPNYWNSTSREYIENRDEMIVNNYAQYCSVVKTQVGGSKLVLGGEIDALWDCRPDRKDDPINWVELKTNATIESAKDLLRYDRKLLKFWAQSFLLGVPKIIVGFRSRDGILQRIEELATNDIPSIVKKRSKEPWDGALCLNFTASFLEWLKSVIDSEGTWRISRKKNSPVIEVFKYHESGHGNILSPEFIKWRTRGSETEDPAVVHIDAKVASAAEPYETDAKATEIQNPWSRLR